MLSNLVDRLNVLAAAMASRSRSKTNIVEFQKRAVRAKKSILLNTMPKSGSVYTAKTLAAILGLDLRYIGHQYVLIDQINVQLARMISAGGYVSQNHLSPSPENLQIIQHFKLKMVLHLRDPRQALLSWIYHLDRVASRNDTSEILLFCAPRTPVGYFDFSLTEKIDWQIENYLPQLVSWVAKWLEVADRGTVEILVTHQHDLRTAEKLFFDRILQFYGFGTDYVLPNLPKTIEETHFRHADPTEWINTFTPGQVARATLVIPPSMMKRFGWNAAGNLDASTARSQTALHVKDHMAIELMKSARVLPSSADFGNVPAPWRIQGSNTD
jgi:hypothetical protein